MREREEREREIRSLDAFFCFMQSQGQQVAVQSNPPLQGGSLLDGSYNEADAHADFQSALAEWRQNKNTASTENRQKKTVSFAPPSE